MILAALALISATPATPATLPASIAAAQPGDTIRLAPGRYPTVNIKGRTGPLSIVAHGATVAGVNIENSSGVTWTGGNVTAPRRDGAAASGYGFRIFGATNIIVRGALVTDGVRGMVIAGSSRVRITGNRVMEMSVDGIDVASGNSHITIDRNHVETFNTGDAHPDNIQLWSRAGQPVSDVVIIHNTLIGQAHGVLAATTVSRGDPGFDRVRIEHNKIQTTTPTGIGLNDCRRCVVRWNEVGGLPGSARRANVYAAARAAGTAPSVVMCGNVVRDLPASAAVKPC